MSKLDRMRDSGLNPTTSPTWNLLGAMFVFSSKGVMLSMITKIAKAGKPRKSRRLRLNISIGSPSRGDGQFAPTPNDWHRIEGVYRPLSPEDREALIVLVEDYFRWQPGETMAPYVDDALAYLKRLENARERFWRLLLEQSHTRMTGTGESAHIAEVDAIRSVAVGYVQSHIGRHLKKFDYKKQTDWRGLLDVMQACAPALEATKRYITEEAARVGFVEGRAWNELVWKLTGFSQDRDLPTGVSKSDDPRKASPFVAFFRELQRTFPPSLQRHEGSNAALAEAITVARRQARHSLAWRAAQKANPPTPPS
jgi:hypothetical protein